MNPRLTTRETADQIGVSQDTMRRWRREGGGPEYLKIGGRYYYEQSAIDAYIEASKVTR